ncbi:MAG: [LysW]-aminoadipate kinase [Candidatus Lokiarchaeota archaeon]|nr:[LysW]-aminoadipate kinase [Candidatus Lokiarchaeota archaeon]
MVVIKIGGALIAKNFDNVINDIAEIYLNKKDKYKLVIVHGGGPQINEILRKMNKEPKYFKTPSGYETRYTDQEAIEVAIMALAGKNNKRLVESMQKLNVNAFGFSGIDGGIIEAKRKDKILVLIDNKRIMKRGEFSGKVINAKNKVLNFLLENDFLPVIASLAKSEDGDIVNVDGDRAASCIAKALNADILISLTDVAGIYRDFEDKNSLIKKITSSNLQNILNTLEGGMKKKAYAALEALDKNLKKVIISSGESKNPISNALEKNTGTVIIND